MMGQLQVELAEYWSILIVWVLPFIIAFGLIYGGYYIRKIKTTTAVQSPIKAVVPSPTNIELTFSQFVTNKKDDRFKVHAYVEIDIENNTDHIIKVASTNLIFLFGKRCSVQSLLYRKLFADGREGPL